MAHLNMHHIAKTKSMLELNPLKPSPSPVLASELYLDVLNLFTLVARTALAVLDYVIFAVKKTEEKNLRNQRLIAYRNRSSWKKSDTQRLKQLGASPVALRRLERATSRSRPSVQRFILYKIKSGVLWNSKSYLTRIALQKIARRSSKRGHGIRITLKLFIEGKHV